MEPIAIIGSSCHLPGKCESPAKLWDFLQKPQDVAQIIPAERFDISSFYSVDGRSRHGCTDAQMGYFLAEDPQKFDSRFFSINRREVEAIDPQHRMLLEGVYEAMENAGITMEQLNDSDTSVFVGMMSVDYHDRLARDVDTMPPYLATGTSRSIASNRISYFFNWHGASMTIDTACSSSLVALHEAVQTLRRRDSHVAVVAGVNLLLGPEQFISESKMHMLSPTGGSRMWDAAADGYTRGEGTGAVILKPLSAAIADGDHIECIVRETGVNQDGLTQGITHPSSKAQASLIRQTYERAGLRWDIKEDRCQYFEAHGTGTPTGDPIEAEAISTAFFGENRKEMSKIYVGSIKTIVGHTEGTAGIAGVLKASLSLQHAVIPRNLHFESLNPKVEPHYENLKVPTASIPWPGEPGSLRRASVNSFGFGGTNAHAILESYQPDRASQPPDTSAGIVPLVFSAASEESLRSQLREYLEYFKSNDAIGLRDLAWTLQARRTMLPVRASFAGRNIKDICTILEAELCETHRSAGRSLGTRAVPGRARILGIFTGQGAQWACMGRDIIMSSVKARQTIQFLENSLALLPPSDRPTWSLEAELLAVPSESRISEAEISQPACTAVQIMLVDLLSIAGLELDAVVGHSSGEIAAAYAAGFITAGDAIRIAYYRGFHTKDIGRAGAMMAVGTTAADAEELFELGELRGRIVVAAINSPSSITASGDIEAIEQAKEVFEDEGKFVRLLKVQVAYHSHHIRACSALYHASLKKCDLTVKTSRTSSCQWFSSVHGREMHVCDELKGAYWRDNMADTVQFAKALDTANNVSGPYGIAIEIGPHPALQGPTLQTIRETNRPKACSKSRPASQNDIPYFSTLVRGMNDMDAFSATLGLLWAHLGPTGVNFDNIRTAFDESKPTLLKGLPNYCWDHGSTYSNATRASRKYYYRGAPHALLGSRCADHADPDLRWRNFIKIDENPWLEGHKIQDQVLFPAAGYIVMALEASLLFAGRHSLSCIELSEVEIIRPLALDERNSYGTEIIFTLKPLRLDAFSAEAALADAICYSPDGSGALIMNFRCRVQLMLGEPSLDTLPNSFGKIHGARDVDLDHFYSHLVQVGYDYTGLFRGVSSMKRRLDRAAGGLKMQSSEWICHPAELDSAFQTLFGAYSAPGDERLKTLHVPQSIKRIRVNPALNSQNPRRSSICYHTFCTETSAGKICGDVDISCHNRTIFQVEGLSCVSLARPTSEDDRSLFSKVVWKADLVDSSLCIDMEESKEEVQLLQATERASFYYLNRLRSELSSGQIGNTCEKQPGSPHSIHSPARHLQVPVTPKMQDWREDTKEIISEITSRFENPTIDLLHTVGEHLPGIIAEDKTTLQYLLNETSAKYYDGMSFLGVYRGLAQMSSQLAHRYPRLRILELIDGQHGATKRILESLGAAYSSYTCAAMTRKGLGHLELHRYAGNVKVINVDLDKNLGLQGLETSSYDLIVCADISSITIALPGALTNIRRAVKPGGYLLFGAATNLTLRMSFLMKTSLLPDHQILSSVQWDSLLRDTGFTGVDKFYHGSPDVDVCSHSVIATQALDERVGFLRRPLSYPSLLRKTKALTILAGLSLSTRRLVNDIKECLRPQNLRIKVINTLDELDEVSMEPGTAILSILELAETLYQSMTALHHEKLGMLFERASDVLWVTRGYEADFSSPRSAMMIGLGRSLRHELPGLRLQFLSVDRVNLDARILSTILLRLMLSGTWKDDESAAGILWKLETELALKDGSILIPRLKPYDPLKDRLNAIDTPIIYPGYSAAMVSNSRKPPSVENNGKDAVLPTSIKYSLHSLIKFSDGVCSYIAIGTPVDSNELQLLLSPCENAHVDVPKHQFFSVPISKTDDPQSLLLLTRAELTAYTLLSRTDQGVLLVHEPDGYLVSALRRQASGFQTTVHLITSISTKPKPDQKVKWHFLHPFSTTRTIKSMLPAGVTVYTSFHPDNDSNGLGTCIARCLSPSCVSAGSLLDANYLEVPLTLGEAQDLLVRAFNEESTYSSEETSGLAATRAAEGLAVRTHLSLHDWTTGNEQSPEVRPTRASDLLRADKTYLLVGLTGELGQSMCEWMVHSGARYIALASRKPKIDSEWVGELTALGAVIEVCTMDVASRQEVKNTVRRIQKLMPPIAGIANGAMVLVDKSFNSMEFGDMETVLKPKVDGSMYLDEMFSENSLDFFILFSSLSAIVGIRGQTNYTAANAFMAALVAQRKQRGLAGCAIDLGMVVGLGVVERSEKHVSESLRKQKFMVISESDFHQILMEAIHVGRPGSTADSQIVTGMGFYTEGEADRPLWADDPRFSHFVLAKKGEAPDAQAEHRDKVHLRQLLPLIDDDNEATRVIEDAFRLKVEYILKIPSGEVKLEEPLTDIGADSLISVEIRAWFLKELSVAIPVVKVLGGSSGREICQDALQRLPAELRPQGKQKIAEIDESPNSNGIDTAGLSASGTSFGSTLETPVATPVSTAFTTATSAPVASLDLTANESAREAPGRTAWLENQRTYRLSQGQSRLWFLNTFLEDRSALNVALLYRVTGSLHFERLSAALNVVTARHEILRTRFCRQSDSGIPVQIVGTSPVLQLEHKPIYEEDDVYKEFEELRRHYFNIEHGETMRVVLLTQKHGKRHGNFIALSAHHIVIDGRSWQIFLRDFEAAYRHEELNQPAQYTDFAIFQSQQVENGDLESQLQYWRNEFSDVPEPLPLLPFSRQKTRCALTNHSYSKVDFRLDADLSIQIKKMCREERVTALHFCITVLQTVLLRLLGVTNLCVGLADAGRHNDEFRDAMGFFLNLLPLRLSSFPDQPFREALKAVRGKTYSALAHASVPLDIILERLKVAHSSVTTPLFQVVVNYLAGNREHDCFADCKLEVLEIEPARTPYDLVLDIIENGEGCVTVLSFKGQAAFYSKDDMQALQLCFETSMKVFLESPVLPLNKAPLFPPGSVEEALMVGRGPQMAAEWPATLAHRIDDMIDRYSEDIAVSDQAGVLTYEGLSKRTDEIAAIMLEADVEDGARVAVFQEPTCDVVCSILAIMRIGAIYVPLDLRNPMERLQAIVADCKPHLILCHDQTKAAAYSGLMSAKMLNLSLIRSSPVMSVANINRACASAPGFLLYTSGSTGHPKGILLSHASFRNQLEVVTKLFSVGRERVLQSSSLGFDMALDQIFTALANGGRVYITPRSAAGDPQEIARIMRKEQITYTFAVPSQYILWCQYGREDLRECKEWRFAFSGGEVLSVAVQNGFQRLENPSLKLYDVYGPSEICVSSHRMEVDYQTRADHEQAVGYTLPNYGTIIVDENLNPLPVGFSGEIVIAGIGVAAGYFGNPELTKQSFIETAFAPEQLAAQGWATVYRSGDRGRLRSDGALVFEGRMSNSATGHQVKIRGQRVEFEDIEAAILRASEGAITHAVVSLRPGDLLVAHCAGRYVATEDLLADVRMRLQLPQYMVPSLFVWLEELPLSPNGKIDRKAVSILPLPEKLSTTTENRARNGCEAEIQNLWVDVLGKDTARLFDINSDSDFFDAGGNSALLVVLQAGLRKKFGVYVPLAELFKASVLKTMALRVSGGISTEAASFDRMDWNAETRLLPLSIAATADPPFRNQQRGADILLTGATGFLGRHLLLELISDPRAHKIHCIAVREPHQLLPIDSSKLEIHPGDLSCARLGLPAETFDRLSGSATAIIHNGADVSFFKSYISLRKPNLESTKELAMLAARTGKIPLHFLSTGGVARLARSSSALSPMSLVEFPPSNAVDGYVASKWASEVFLENSAKEWGIPVCIHRPTSIMGENASSSDIMHNLLRFTRRMKAFPDIQAVFDFVSAETVAKKVVAEVLEGPNEGLRFMHHCAEKRMSAEELKESLESEAGEPFSLISLGEWITNARIAGIDSVVADYMGTLDPSGGMLPLLAR